MSRPQKERIKYPVFEIAPIHEVAEICGVRYEYVDQIARGVREWSEPLKLKLRLHFDKSENELFTVKKKV